MYSGAHSIIFFNGNPTGDNLFSGGFGDIFDTWSAFGLIPTDRPVISPPALKTNTVEIPGSNGSLDLSMALTGYPLYKNRTGSLEFVCETSDDAESDNYWVKKYSALIKTLHGKNMKMLLVDETDAKNGLYFYEGRIDLTEWTNEKSRSKITISYDLYPFRKSAKLMEYQTYTSKYPSLDTSDGVMTLEAGEVPVVPSFYAEPNGTSNYVVIQETSYQVTNKFKWTDMRKLNIDGTDEDSPRDRYDANAKWLAVSEYIYVEPGDMFVLCGWLSARHLNVPYLVAYDENGNVVTYLFASESVLEAKLPTNNEYDRWMPETPYVIPNGVAKVRLCFENGENSSEESELDINALYKGKPRYLPVGEKTYFPNIVLESDRKLYFRSQSDDDKIKVTAEYRKEKL